MAAEDPLFTVEVNCIDYSRLADLTGYKLANVVGVLRYWFPAACFDVTVQQPATPNPEGNTA